MVYVATYPLLTLTESLSETKRSAPDYAKESPVIMMGNQLTWLKELVGSRQLFSDIAVEVSIPRPGTGREGSCNQTDNTLTENEMI